MIGKRVQLVEQQGGFESLNPGEYGQYRGGAWYACAPNGECANLGSHQVTEHEDGTITVAPSILISTSHDRGKTMVELWHGYLERGVWRQC